MSREPEAHLAHPAGSASISTARHEFPFHNQGLIKREDELPVKFEKLRDMSKVGPEQSDVLWYYSKQSLSPKMGNNSRGGRSSNAEEKDLSQDAQGFIMLEGPPSSIDNSFATAHTVVRKEARIPNFKRSDVTSNMSTLESVFDPLEQTLYVYCNYRPGSDECKRVWIDGAEDTIIRLPEHVGEGPFARIVSIKPVNEDYKLPDHHLIHRRAERLSDPVYEIKIDYNFQAVQPKKDDHPISIRVDYTNLRGYWEEISVAEARRKRSFKGDTPAKVHDWQARVNKAVARDQEYAKRSDSFHATKVMSGGDGAQLHRRWWAEFIEWLRRITRMTASSLSILRLSWGDSIHLFRSTSGCTGRKTGAKLEIELEAAVSLDVTYAYYFSGTIIPPSMPDAYAYLSMEPNAYLSLRMSGHAEMDYRSQRTPIIDTITYPGLAIKGLIAIGPSLDIYGQIRGRIVISGQARAGARVNFGRAEVYWPQEDEASKKYEKLLGIESESSVLDRDLLEPFFEADVELNAGLDITVQPQVNFGIKVGNEALPSGLTLVDAQLSGYLVGGLSFQATSHINHESNELKYSYGVYLIYNLGYTAKAIILDMVGWALQPREVFYPDKRISVYGPVTGSVPWDSHEDGVSATSRPNNSAEASASEMAAPRDKSIYARVPKRKSQKIAPTFNSQLSCPIKRKRKIKLPELRYNCDHFGSSIIRGTANYSDASVPGLCQTWRKLNPIPKVLTFSNSEVNKKRKESKCPSNFCDGQNRLYMIKTGRQATTICNNALPPTVEEESDSLYGTTPTPICAPKYQTSEWNEAGCHKLLQNLVSNWAEMEPIHGNKRRTSNWVSWIDPKKWTTANKHGTIEQRATKYPNAMPLPDGMPRRSTVRTSWVFRRNYTWSTIDNATDPRKWWDAKNYSFVASPEKPSGWDSILCALNTFGQNSVYRLNGGYNAICLRNSSYNADGFQGIRRVAPCLITFTVADKDI
ncbi:hypothetical protein XA68_17786 [Ophiocordyceps unilateralis]|uniref:Uncharacterized protein n=1 Tax=Ophiocordyceps unilateralis TaxID=268505 RepID=A0A2A9PK59_OPHUN|nr:hypothetical protein XA68_17786 [Ophiocordyceps unilateralis]